MNLIQEVLKNKNVKRPRKIILIFSTNLNKNIKFPDETKVFNIYSTKDFLSRRAIFILSLGKGSQHLRNVDNITLNDMYHSEIEGDKRIESGIYKGMTGFELAEKLLLN